MRYKTYDRFPTCKKTVKVGDIWYAYFPFRELGNFEKLRPVYISYVDENTIKAKMITGNSKKGKLIVIKNKVKAKLLYKEATLTEDKLYSKIVASNNFEVKEKI